MSRADFDTAKIKNCANRLARITHNSVAPTSRSTSSFEGISSNVPYSRGHRLAGSGLRGTRRGYIGVSYTVDLIRLGTLIVGREPQGL